MEKLNRIARGEKTVKASGDSTRSPEAVADAVRSWRCECLRESILMANDADYYTCTNEACRAYQKTFRSDEAAHFGCEDCRSENPEEFPHIALRHVEDRLPPVTDSAEGEVSRADDVRCAKCEHTQRFHGTSECLYPVGREMMGRGRRDTRTDFCKCKPLVAASR